jgi:aspartyl/asparaginyl-tRNA synthetase
MRSVSPPRSWKDVSRHFSLALTHPWYRAVFALTTELCWSTMDFFRKELLFAPALTPVTTDSISSPMGLGSDSLPVQISLFDRPVYLADSMQFHLEYLLRHGPRGIFYIMPTFRGEDPDSRHLNQFFHVEAEMCGTLDDVMALVERYVGYCAMRLLENHSVTIERIAGDISHLEWMSRATGRIPRLTFSEVTALLGDAADLYMFHDGKRINLSRHGEAVLMRQYGGCVWVTHFPPEGVPFYQAVDPGAKTALCADLLFGIGETVGAGQRHFGPDETMAALRLRGNDLRSYEWYIRLKREHPLQTSGFGLGLERYLLWVLKHDDVRDVPIFLRLKDGYAAP